MSPELSPRPTVVDGMPAYPESRQTSDAPAAAVAPGLAEDSAPAGGREILLASDSHGFDF